MSDSTVDNPLFASALVMRGHRPAHIEHHTDRLTVVFPLTVRLAEDLILASTDALTINDAAYHRAMGGACPTFLLSLVKATATS